MTQRLAGKWEWLAYGALAILVMVPMLKPGYILTLDMVFTPKLGAPTTVINSYLWQYLLHVLNWALPSQVIQKLMMFAILVGSGVGMHRLVGVKSEWARYFGGIFYVVNPYTYERWLAGDYLLLAGYAVLPWLIKALLDWVEWPRFRHTAKLVGWYCLMAILSVHMLAMSVVAGVIVVAVHGRKIIRGNELSRLVIMGLGVAVGFVVLNYYWLAQVLKGTSPISQTIAGINGKDLAAFTTASNPHMGLVVNVVSLYGFWLERFHRYVMPNMNLVLWLVPLAIILGLVGVGIGKLWRSDRTLAIGIAVIGMVGISFASGIHAPLVGELNLWLINHAPLAKGFREPEKFNALTALAYAWFGAYGLEAVLIWIKRSANLKASRDYLATAALFVPILLVPTMPFGFVNQLHPVNYPASWAQFNQTVASEPGNFKLLFLPWHEYMSYDFEPRVIANPAPAYFAKPVISGDNAEFGDVYTTSTNPTSQYVQSVILAQSDPRFRGDDNGGNQGATDLGDALNAIGVKYVLLAHGPDWTNYGWLDHSADLKLISADNSLKVYLNLRYKPHG